MLSLSQASALLKFHPEQLRKHITGTQRIPDLPSLRCVNTSQGTQPRWKVEVPDNLRPPDGLFVWQAARRMGIKPTALTMRIRRGQVRAKKWGWRWIIQQTA